MENEIPGNEKKKLLISLSRALIERIEDFRFENRMPSRSEAIRHLVTEALKKYENPPASNPKKKK